MNTPRVLDSATDRHGHRPRKRSASWRLKPHGNQLVRALALTKAGSAKTWPKMNVMLLERIENQMSHFRAHSNSAALSCVAGGQIVGAVAGIRTCCAPRWTWHDLATVHSTRPSRHWSTPGDLAPACGIPTAVLYRPRQQSAGHAPRAGSKWISMRDNRLRQTGNVTLNLAAIAKGFAVDAVSELLTQSGWQHSSGGNRRRIARRRPEAGGRSAVVGGAGITRCRQFAARDAHRTAWPVGGDLRRLPSQLSNRRTAFATYARPAQRQRRSRTGWLLVTVIHPECMPAGCLGNGDHGAGFGRRAGAGGKNEFLRTAAGARCRRAVG